MAAFHVLGRSLQKWDLNIATMIYHSLESSKLSKFKDVKEVSCACQEDVTQGQAAAVWTDEEQKLFREDGFRMYCMKAS